jgi:ATP-dependent Clp protease, protease subunit
MKRAKWSVKDAAKEAEVYLYSEIGEDWWGDGITAKDFIEDLQALPASVEKVIVRINSPGGDVFEGFAIYQALLRDRRQIVTAVDGLAASVASLVMMAGDEINAANTSMVMVHDPWTIAIGNAEDFRAVSEVLDQITGQIVSAYGRRDKVDQAAIREAMRAETWYTAEQAQEIGLVDTVTEATVAVAAKVPPGRYQNAPKRLLGAQVAPAKPTEARHRLAAARRALQLVE